MIVPNLGRLTKFLMSRDPKVRMKGLKLFHTRPWHASVKEMQKFLDRAGVEVPESELKEIVKSRHACRMWELPKSMPKDRRGGPERVNQQVEFDVLIDANRPIGHLID